jgi:hypothetical protein
VILQRFSTALRNLDWVTVSVELLIVILGVVLGLQVNNWNQARNDRERAAVYIANLAQDIRSDIADIDEIIRVSTLRMSAMGYLLEQATGAPLPTGFDSARGRIEIEPSPRYAAGDSNTIGVAMFILTTLKANRLTYDTMINTGGIGIVRDDALVREIQTYYAKVDKVASFELSIEINREKLVDAQQQAGLSPVDMMPAEELARVFGQDDQLLAAAKNYWLYTNRHLKVMKELRTDSERLASHLEQRLSP